MRDFVEKREGYQLSFFQLDDPVLSQIRDEIVDLDVNNLTPIEALKQAQLTERYLKKITVTRKLHCPRAGNPQG
jgi:DNA mismatch repair protein MutS